MDERTTAAGDGGATAGPHLDAVDGSTGLDPAQHAQELLAEHVPLTLLVDLLTPTGETSAELLRTEGLPEEEWWDGAEGGATPA